MTYLLRPSAGDPTMTLDLVAANGIPLGMDLGSDSMIDLLETLPRDEIVHVTAMTFIGQDYDEELTVAQCVSKME